MLKSFRLTIADSSKTFYLDKVVEISSRNFQVYMIKINELLF